jgi:hypothetical protein
MRDQQEILDEIARLEAIKPRIGHLTVFGDDNHTAIDVQVQVLVGRLSHEDIYDAWGDETDDDFSQYYLDAALDAYDWMMCDEDTEQPSISWESME